MASTRPEDAEALASASGVPRAAMRATIHLRRYMPLYVFGTIWAVMVALLPTVHHSGSNSANVAQSAGAGDQGSGVARSGVQCGPGVRQIAGSAYAAPCVGAFSGENGGATYNGVSKDTITIAIRSTSDANGPNAQAVDRVQSQAGQLTATQQVEAIKELLPYFNKNWELYGRQVKLVEWTGQGNGTDEAQSKGTETACSDANTLASSVHAFGVIRHGTFGYESQPFAQ